MNKPFPLITFIDRLNYTELQNSFFTLDEIAEVMHKDNPKVSILTRGYITILNKHLKKLIGSSCSSVINNDFLKLLNNKEKNYIKDTIKSNMLNENIVYNANKKYYELIILPDKTLLAVVDEGFLKIVTDSKDNLLKFILDCLGYHYKYNFNLSYLFKTYISLKLNDNYFKIINLMVSASLVD